MLQCSRRAWSMPCSWETLLESRLARNRRSEDGGGRTWNIQSAAGGHRGSPRIGCHRGADRGTYRAARGDVAGKSALRSTRVPLSMEREMTISHESRWERRRRMTVGMGGRLDLEHVATDQLSQFLAACDVGFRIFVRGVLDTVCSKGPSCRTMMTCL